MATTVKKFLFCFVFCALTLATDAYAQILTIGKPTLSFTQICADANYNTVVPSLATVNFTFSPASALKSDNQFIVELSDPNGSFANPTVLVSSGAGTVTTSAATIGFRIPTNTAGEAYKIRIRSSSPTSISPESVPFSAYYQVQNTPFSINSFVSTATYCAGGNYLLKIDNPGTGTNDSPLKYPSLTYKWYKEATPSPILVGSAAELSVNQPGSYYVETNYGSCTSNSYSNRVKVSEVSATVSAITSSKGNPFCTSEGATTLRAQSANSYQWYLNDVIINGETSSTYNANKAGRLRENEGIAIGLFQQNYGVFTTFGAVTNFAHNVVLDQDSNLTFGLNLGFYKSGLNSGKVISNYPDPALDNIPSNVLFSANPGINYGTAFLDFGISLNNLFLYNFKTANMVQDDPEKSIQLHAMHTGYLDSYGFFDKSKFSALLKTDFKKEKTVISGLMMFTIPNGVWAQGGYNTLYGISAGLGLNITSSISMEYNYEKATGNLANFGSSHEITLAYKFKSNKYYQGDEDTEGAIITPVPAKKYVPSKPKTTAAPQNNSVAAAKAKLAGDARIKEYAEAKAKAAALTQAKLAAATKIKADAAAKANAAALTRAKAVAAAKIKADTEAKLVAPKVVKTP